MNRPVLSLLLVLVLAACNNNAAGPGDKTVQSDGENKNVRNKISVKAKGIKLEQAFLLFEDGKLVPEGNKIEVGQKVLMRLLIDGWKAKDGKVMLGASEKISTDDGRVVMDEQDLFATNTGIDPKDAKVITLSATITQIDKLFKYFEVAFRVWDKNSDDNASGSYRLYLK